MTDSGPANKLRDRVYNLLINDYIGTRFPWERITPDESQFPSFGEEGICQVRLNGGASSIVYFYVSKIDSGFMFRAWRDTISNGIWTAPCYSERDILRALSCFLTFVAAMKLNT